jgi:hypothetical protein
MSLPSSPPAADSFRQKLNYGAALNALDQYERLSNNNPDAWNIRGILYQA